MPGPLLMDLHAMTIKHPGAWRDEGRSRLGRFLTFPDVVDEPAKVTDSPPHSGAASPRWLVPLMLGTTLPSTSFTACALPLPE